MKKVLILYGGSDKFKSDRYRQDYELLYEMGAKKGIKFYRSNIEYYCKNSFKTALTFENKIWISKKNIFPDMVFDFCDSKSEYIKIKKEEIAKSIKMINDPYFDFIFGSKYLTYAILDDFMSKTFIAYNQKDLIDKTKLFKSKIVLKPDRGFGGKDIKIFDRREITKIVAGVSVYPVVVQKFVDSRLGLGKIAKSTHDLRIIFINHKPVISYVREPASGSLISNVSLGGKRTMVDLNLIPIKLRKKIDSILQRLKIFNDVIYSIDFIFDKNKNPYIIEVNSPPSLHVEDMSYLKIYYKEVIQFLRKIG